MSIVAGIIGIVTCVVMIGALGTMLVTGVARQIDEIRHPEKYDKWRIHRHGG